MNWLHYLLEANVYLAVAYGCYWLLFRKQTFYTANRIYLLLSTVICFVIPLIQIEYLQSTTIEVPSPILLSQFNSTSLTVVTPRPTESTITPYKAITAVYITVALAILVLFLIKLYSLLKLVLRNKRNKQVGYTLVYVDQTSTPFSFFGYLFVKDSSRLQEIILKHELAHIRQKHSWDIVFTELLKIINWFNPVVYLLQDSLKELHEFEADRCAADSNHQDDYVNMLVSQAYQTSGVPFANHFSNQQLLKSRIMKLYQKRSGRLARLNYLVALPLCAGLLFASTMAFSKDYGWIKVRLNTQANNELALSTLTKPTNGNYSTDTPKHVKSISNNSKLLPPPPPPAKPGRVKLPPPPPSGSARNVVMAMKNQKMPPPPPPASTRSSIPAVETATLLPPPPPPSAQLKLARGKALEVPIKGQSDSAIKSIFLDMFKHLQRTMRYPKTAADNNVTGAVMASFKVGKDQHVSDVAVKKSAHPDLDAEILKNISSYNNTLKAKPGTYTMLVDYVLENGDGTRTPDPRKVTEQEIPTAGKIVIIGYGNKK